MNTSDTELVIEGLKPNTEYDFSVKMMNSQQWSMSAVNKTLPAPPSSAPRDLTVLPNRNDPSMVTLSWQPPKYANGDVEGWLVSICENIASLF